MMSMNDSPDNFRFLVSLFRKDLTKFNKDAKEHIISALKEGYEKAIPDGESVPAGKNNKEND